MSSWKQRQKAWKRERQQKFKETGNFNIRDDETQLDTSNSSDTLPSSQSEHNNYQHVITEPHTDSISVLRVRVYNRKFYFGGFPSGDITLLRGQSYIIDLSHPSNQTHQLVVSRSTTHGAVNGMVAIGEPGSPGAFVALFIGNGRPRQLYYYCANHRGMSGNIVIQDSG